MISPKEYIDRKAPEKAHFYIHDIFKHLMTASESPAHGLHRHDRQDRLDFHRDVVTQEMRRPTEDRRDLNEELNTFEHRRRHRERDADTGNIDIDRYLDGDERPFNDVFTETTPKPATTIILDMYIACNERNGEEMRRRHRYIYREAVKAEMEGSPLRVIACFNLGIEEEATPRRVYVTIKDYQDPIFPEIWSTLKTNASTNSTLNLIIYTLIGTQEDGNGHGQSFTCDEDFPGDEELILIDPRRVTTERGRVINTEDGDGDPAPRPATPPPYNPGPRYERRNFRPRRRRLRRY